MGKAAVFFLAGIIFALGCSGKAGESGAMKVINLPAPNLKGKISLEETVAERRSKRRYLQRSLSPEQIGQLLWAAQGITEKKRSYRAAPSAGATYPLETYTVTAEGVYRYLPREHKLGLIKEGDLRDSLTQAAWGQSFISEAPLNIVLTAVYSRTTGTYGQRGIQYVHIEVGHVAENIHLQAVALGLGSVPVGAFSDEAVKKVLGLDRNEQPLYIIPVGYTEK